MKKLLIFFSIVLISIITKAQKGNFQLSEEQSISVLQSTEFQNEIKLHNDFLDIISSKIKQGISLQTIQNSAVTAINTNNYEGVYQLLFGSYESGEIFFNSLAESRRVLKVKFSFITEHPEIFTCNSCDNSTIDKVNSFFKNFAVYDSNRFIPGSTGSSSYAPAPVCGSYWNQVKLGICAAAVGASTAGIGAAAGLWGCWCTFCTQNSQVANVICAH